MSLISCGRSLVAQVRGICSTSERSELRITSTSQAFAICSRERSTVLSRARRADPVPFPAPFSVIATMVRTGDGKGRKFSYFSEFSCFFPRRLTEQLACALGVAEDAGRADSSLADLPKPGVGGVDHGQFAPRADPPEDDQTAVGELVEVDRHQLDLVPEL